jgi:hypothetical protein
MELLKRHIQNCLLHHNQKRDFLINNGTNGSKFYVNTYHIVKIFKSLSEAHHFFLQKLPFSKSGLLFTTGVFWVMFKRAIRR